MLTLAITLEPSQLALLALLGLLAGVLGGMLGVGGSVIMIPGMHFLLSPDQQLFQAAAMLANVAVALPSAWRHYKAGAVVPRAVKWMLPAALVMILIGVYLTTLQFLAADNAVMLQRIFAVFLLYIIALNLRKLFSRSSHEDHPHNSRVTRPRALGIGGIMGSFAGLLGIGGGGIAVPLQQVVFNMPLRNCIANSAVVMCVTATFGAGYKNWTLETAQRFDSMTIALALAPTCVLGGYLGSYLTHVLPQNIVRIVFIILMAVSALKMSGLIG